MNFFEKVVNFLVPTMAVPPAYGVFHLTSVLLVLIFTLYFALRHKNTEDGKVRRVLLVFWIVIMILEVYKQIAFAFNYNGGDPIWDYAWYVFPFQFCSTPHYILPFIIFLKEGKIRDAFIAFLCSFSLLAGISVMVMPGDVLCYLSIINVQTMFHHGSQVLLGVWLAVLNRKKLSLRFFLSGIAVFISLVCVAMILNVIVYRAMLSHGSVETFNMFFISPYFPCTLPVLSDIFAVAPYPVFLLAYLFAFSLGATVIYLIAIGIRRLAGGKRERDGEC